MKNKIKKEKLSNKQADRILKAFDYSLYWLNVLVNNKEISIAQAGALIVKVGI